VENDHVFSPPRRTGFLFNLIILLLLVVAGGWSIFEASQTEVGLPFLLYLILGLIAFGMALVFAYRVRALLNATYELDRNSIHLSWGLRAEEIPMDKVLWANLASEMEPAVPLPLLRWPGSVLGTRRTKEGIRVEFFAAHASNLVLVGTEERVFALSPEDPERLFTNLRAPGPNGLHFSHPGSLDLSFFSFSPLLERSGPLAFCCWLELA
jgi:hypothetical protein